MTTNYAEDSENTEPSDDTGATHDDLQEELVGEFAPHPPATATEEPDIRSHSGQDETPEQESTNPGAG